jgi:hypothetical protein
MRATTVLWIVDCGVRLSRQSIASGADEKAFCAVFEIKEIHSAGIAAITSVVAVDAVSAGASAGLRLSA